MQFVQIRLQSKNNSINVNNIKHNLRISETKNQINKNNNILIYNGEVINDNKEIKKYFSKIEKERQELIKEHNENFKKNNGNRKLKNYHSSISEGVITFSNSLNEKIKDKYFLNDFIEKSKETIKEFEKFTNTKVLYTSIHLDEKTPHLHFHFKNFNEEGKSIHNTLKNKESGVLLQDLSEKYFKDLGFNRGISKEITNNNHQETKVFHENQIKELETNYKNLLELTKELRKEIPKLELTVEERKNEYEKLSSIQNEIRENIKEIKLSTKKGVELIKAETDKVINKSIKKGLISDKIDETLLRLNLTETLKKFTKVNFSNIETEKLKEENKELKKENENLKEKVEDLTEKTKEIFIKKFDEDIAANKLSSKLSKYLEENEELKKNMKNMEYKTFKKEEEIKELKEKLKEYQNQNPKLNKGGLNQ